MGNEYPQGPVQDDPFKKGDGKPALIVGVVLVAVGIWLSAWRLNLIPDFFWTGWNFFRNAGWGLAVIIIGVVIIMWSRSGSVPHMPAKGTRLYRSTSDKWLAGVIGGLARYFDVDPTLLRLAYIALMLANVGGLIIAYIIMAIVVPEEPPGTPAQ